jgi:hypothetical protein
LIVVITPFFTPGLCGSPGEVGEADRRHAGDVLDVVVWPGAVAGGDGLGQHAEPLAVLGGHAGRDAAVDPCIAVDVVVLCRPAADVGDDVGGVADRERLGAGRCVLGAVAYCHGRGHDQPARQARAGERLGHPQQARTVRA